MSPTGYNAAKAEIEARVGGRHRIWLSAPDGVDMGGVEAEIIELVPNQRLAFRWWFVGPERESPRFRDPAHLVRPGRRGRHHRADVVHERLEAAEPRLEASERHRRAGTWGSTSWLRRSRRKRRGGGSPSGRGAGYCAGVAVRNRALMSAHSAQTYCGSRRRASAGRSLAADAVAEDGLGPCRRQEQDQDDVGSSVRHREREDQRRVDMNAPIPCAKRFGGPATGLFGPSRGATTFIANRPSGLSFGPSGPVPRIRTRAGSAASTSR